MLDVTRAALSAYTTLRLGGPALRLVTAQKQDELVDIVRAARASGEPLALLAGGSNVVIADEGVPATVILIRTTGMGIQTAGQSTPSRPIASQASARRAAEDPVQADSGVLLTVEAGQPWDEVVAFAVAEGLAGVECLSGIPGSAGATPIQNVGAYGQEVAETIARVRVFDREASVVRDLTAAQCQFAYRSSLFKHSDRYVVLAVTFRLSRSDLSAPVRYAELARTLGIAAGDRAPLAEVRATVLALRAGKAMVLDPTDPDTYSVGSFFVNPVLDPAAFAALCDRARVRVGAEPTMWPGLDGRVKISAAWLIERAGFSKGYGGRHPGVAVSSKHTLALTNRGSGSTTALLALAREIRDGVHIAFGVELRPEPVLLNCTL